MKTRALLSVVCIVLGCRANMQARGSANLSADGSANVDQEGSASLSQDGDAAWSEGDGETQAIGAQQPLGPGEAPLLGARHDLALVAERATNQCQCLAVALGASDLPAFRWKTGAPRIDPETQLVIALSSQNQGCTEPKGSLGASYWGYRIQGNDVVVYVESAVSGRPLTAGGIIPKPFGEGQVYVAPASRRAPYGRAADAKAAQCKLGNPGALRTKPVDPSEQGNEELRE